MTESNESTPTTAAKATGNRKGQKKAGRPSLGAQDKPSPQIAFRVIPGLRKRAKDVADGEGLTVSQLSRKALKQYLDKAAPTKGKTATPKAKSAPAKPAK